MVDNSSTFGLGSGIGDIVNGNSDTISMGANASATFTGNVNNLNLGASDSVLINGTTNANSYVISDGIGDNVILQDSSGDTMYTVAGDTFNVIGGVANAIYGSDAVGNYSGGGYFNLYGNHDTITTQSDQYGDIGINGQSNTIYLATGAQGGEASLSNGASYNTIYGTSDSVAITGTNIVGVALDGTKDSVNVNGNSDSLTLSNGSSDSVDLSGNSDSLAGTGTLTFMGSSDSVTLSGGWGVSDMSNDTLNLLSGANVDIYNGLGNIVGGISDTVNFTGSDSTLTGFSDGKIDIGGVSDAFFGVSDAVHLDNNSTLIIDKADNDSVTVGGTNDKIIDDLSGGGSIVDYINGGSESFKDFTGADGTGSIDGSGTGSGGGIGGGSDPTYYYYYYADLSSAKKTGGSGSNVVSISQFDNAISGGASTATGASATNTSEPTGTAIQQPGLPTHYQSNFESGAIKGDTVTWSFADINIGNTPGEHFSSFISAADQSVIEKAISEWGAASGLHFEEVSDSSQAGIRIGWGDLDTSATGVLGLTTLKNSAGSIADGTVIRLEDPNQLALEGSPQTQLEYSGTNQTLYALALHEIGHALGLADNADPSSVMYYQSTAQTLDANDLAGIHQLYDYGQLTSKKTTGDIGLDFGNTNTGSHNDWLQPAIDAHQHQPLLSSNNHQQL